MLVYEASSGPVTFGLEMNEQGAGSEKNVQIPLVHNQSTLNFKYLFIIKRTRVAFDIYRHAIRVRLLIAHPILPKTSSSH